MAISTFERKEIKFLLNTEQYNSLMEILPKYMEFDAYCVGGKDYGIFNVYYDTPDDFLIRESLSKPYYKEKIRLRSYAESAGADDTVFLEIKKKIGGIVNKRRVTMTLKEAESYMKFGKHPDDKDKFINKQIIGEIDQFKDTYFPLVPKQYISYRRQAFFGKDDHDFRLTIDNQLTGRREHVNLEENSWGDLILGENQRLMEVKILNSMPMWLADYLSQFGIYKTSFSKYGMAYKQYEHTKMFEFTYTNSTKNNKIEINNIENITKIKRSV